MNLFTRIWQFFFPPDGRIDINEAYRPLLLEQMQKVRECAPGQDFDFESLTVDIQDGHMVHNWKGQNAAGQWIGGNGSFASDHPRFTIWVDPRNVFAPCNRQRMQHELKHVLAKSALEDRRGQGIDWSHRV